MQKYCIFIGRFSPFHKGHEVILKKAFDMAEKVIVVLGSHNRAKNIKNPWSSDERKQMIEATCSPEQKARLIFVYMNDFLYNDTMWVATLQNKIAEASEDVDPRDITLIGFNSDQTSYYLKLFPNFAYYNCPTEYEFHATKIRNFIFHKDNSYKNCVHPNVASYLEEWMKTPEFNRLKEEFDFIAEYKEKWRGAPFTPIFCTVDTLCLKSGHILVVRRKGKLGKGLLALPGGFLNQDETLLEGALRELKEEIVISISKDELKKCVVDQKVLDFPYRSLRGRTISHVFFINLGIGSLPKVKGQDDSEKSWWMPINEFYQRQAEFFEDHWDVVHNFISKA